MEYDVCLDHVITNLKNVDDFSVLADNISDHRGLAVTIDCPRAERRRDFECVAPVEEHAKTPSDPGILYACCSNQHASTCVNIRREEAR